MQCRHCWIEVKPRPDGSRTWGRGEDEDTKRWVHVALLNDSGNPACNRTFLSDDDLEESDSDTNAEA